MSETANVQARRLPAGTTVLGLLLALYYSTVVVAGLHFTVLQLVTLWGLVLIFIPSYRASLTRSEAGLLLAVAVIFAVAALSYVVNGLWDHPDANLSRYARFLFFVPIFLVARNFATAAGFWYALLLGSLVTGIVGVLEFAGLVRYPDDKWPEVNAAVNPIQFGDLSLLMALMTCAGLPVYRRRGHLVLGAAVMAITLGFFACLASSVRGAWIAVPVPALLIGWVFVRGGLVSARQLAAGAIAGALLLAIVIPHTQVPIQVERAFSQLQDYREGRMGRSVGYRFEMWRAAWRMYTEHPVLGVGPGLYQVEAQALGAQGGYDRDALHFSHPHSEYFFVLATLGSLGIVGLALLLLWPLRQLCGPMLSADADLRSLGLAGVVMVVGYLHFGLTEALFFQHATFLGFYLLSLAVLVTLIDRRTNELAEQSRTGVIP